MWEEEGVYSDDDDDDNDEEHVHEYDDNDKNDEDDDGDDKEEEEEEDGEDDDDAMDQDMMRSTIAEFLASVVAHGPHLNVSARTQEGGAATVISMSGDRLGEAIQSALGMWCGGGVVGVEWVCVRMDACVLGVCWGW